jgi:hypothetical protein
MNKPTQEQIDHALTVLSQSDRQTIVDTLLEWDGTEEAQNLAIHLREVSADVGVVIGDQHGGDAYETTKDARYEEDDQRKHDLYYSALTLIGESTYVYRKTGYGTKPFTYDKIETCIDASIAHALEKSDSKRLSEETYHSAVEHLEKSLASL